MIFHCVNAFFLFFFYYFCCFQHMETSGSPSVCNQAGDAEMDQEGAVHGRTFAAHNEKEGDRKSKTIDFIFSSVLPLSADPAGSV